jgi:hypothetical protein
MVELRDPSWFRYLPDLNMVEIPIVIDGEEVPARIRGRDLINCYGASASDDALTIAKRRHPWLFDAVMVYLTPGRDRREPDGSILLDAKDLDVT